ncbi:YopX family protein [Dysgonomonas mossii]|uniref:YopX protein domain-containing protein n=1 Tax=Dysgonomonas mossii DSM 22836 TaxID=742767 RepID=F8X543_9BACT|nr:YopX family protein [Dysgonomonas mossii]EGK04741.1 hypothetical protein HMPREF9456_03352 [Dysgonomonas mossii DSM 22836]
MRKIIFRGKPKSGYNYGNGWLYGSLIQIDENNYGIVELSDISYDENGYIDYSHTPVISETIGQFTGLTDKNGKEIYEGDIIQDNNGIGVIMWFQTSWGIASYAYGYDGLKSYTAVDSFYSKETKEWAVIGNIHDNPSLLK